MGCGSSQSSKPGVVDSVDGKQASSVQSGSKQNNGGFDSGPVPPEPKAPPTKEIRSDPPPATTQPQGQAIKASIKKLSEDFSDDKKETVNNMPSSGASKKGVEDSSASTALQVSVGSTKGDPIHCQVVQTSSKKSTQESVPCSVCRGALDFSRAVFQCALCVPVFLICDNCVVEDGIHPEDHEIVPYTPPIGCEASTLPLHPNMTPNV